MNYLRSKKRTLCRSKMEKNILEHIAIIMDGNGRWALSRGLPRTAGHKKGAEVLLEISKAAKQMGVRYLTVYAFSTENWKRSKDEVDTLMGLLRQYLSKDFNELVSQGIRVRFIGERDMLPSDILEKMGELEEKTKDNLQATLQVALSYGSRAEIVQAVKNVASKIKNGDMSIKEIDEKTFADMLYTKDIPDPDILIRTSGEQRLSNFLLWQLAYAEFFFVDTYWPDFTGEELKQIIEKYQKRDRRYGKN
ncbi:MAG: isoprenyl transferase [Alphaproteobacteria bacterium]|nr:isoprenyl transferase [Alphaproteobacteria bacterium]